MKQFDNQPSARTNRFRKLYYAVLLSCSMAFSYLASATNFTPTTFADPDYTSVNNANGMITGGAGVGLISLRSALQAADATAGPHTITLLAGTYNVSGGVNTGTWIFFGSVNNQNITINGVAGSPLTTIITMSGVGAFQDRIFGINVLTLGATVGVNVSINSVKFTNGHLNSDPYGGGAIEFASTGNTSALTLTNCEFNNNTIDAAAGTTGGAVNYSGSGTFTVTNCTFTSNTNANSDGGAIYYFFNNLAANNTGVMNVTGCTFTGNSVTTASARGGAIGIGTQGRTGTQVFTANITNNTFTNNTAPLGEGGAIVANNTSSFYTVNINFNRLNNNSAGGSGTSASSALAMNANGAGGGNVNAINNWWGCNTDPSTLGACNRAAIVGGASVGSLTTNPWLQLKTTASPNPICNTAAGLGNTTTVTTSFLSNSASTAIPVGNIPVLIGLPVTWGPTTLGSLSAQQATIQASGTATATFTSNGTGGNATVNTEVDNVPVGDLVARATISVHTIPTVTNPVNFTSCVGGTATFTSTITGNLAPTITWRKNSVALANGVQPSGSTVAGQGTATLTISNVQAGDGDIYDVVATNECGTATSATATLIVNQVTGGTVGSDQTICTGGDPAAFTESVASTGSGALTYQWQSSTTSCGAGFSNIGGATATTYDPPSGLGVTTYYRRVTTSTLNAVACTANSTCITVTVNGVTGGTVGIDQTVCSGGDPNAFTQSVASTGSGALTYQWQSSTTSCAAGFSDIGGATATTYDPPSGAVVTTYYRRVTTSTLNAVLCTANSNCVTVFVNDVSAGTVGSDQTICSGGDPAAFTIGVASTGSGAITYQWQSNTTGCAAAFSNIGGATAATYDAPAGLVTTTYYRRITTSTLNAVACTSTSNCITVTINNVTGGTVGTDQTICSGGDPAAFTESVASTGSGALTYQWQSSTTSCAAGFSNIGGATATTYDPPSGLAATTYYRRVTTSTLNAVACTANSTCVTVTVNNVTGGTVAIDHAVCPGGDPNLLTQSVASTGSGALTYQWQSSTTSCAAGFSDIGGATGLTYDPPPGLAVTTYYHRVTTSTLNAVLCTATSNCITVTVNPTNTITLTSAAGTDNQTVLVNTPITNITYATTGATGATFSGLPPGVSGGWAANVVTLSGIPTVSGTFNYTITLTGGCGLITATGTINVITCSITLTSAPGTDAQSVCFNGTPITNITYSTVTATGATFSGLPPGVNGVWAANVVTISGTPTSSGIFNYTITLTGGGCGSVTANGSITVNPIPDAVATPSSQTVCSGVPIAGIAFSGSVGGTTYSWTRDNVGTITGSIGASGSGNIAGTLINNTGSPVTVTFTITPTAAGCTGTAITATVLVNPLPTATITGGGLTVCEETNPVLSAPIDPNYTYSWGKSYFAAPFTAIGTGQTQVVTASGIYQLVVTNQYGCTASATTIMNVADYVFNGSLGAGDPQQTGRINRFAVISTCAAPKACPGIFTAVGARFYDAYTVTNVRNVPVCATIGVNSSCATNIFSVAYSNSFNPASPCTNYLADPGSSPTTSIFYEATIPANGTIVVVIHEVNPGTGCTGYALTVDVPRDPAAITVSPSATVCSGTPVTLTASYANSYLWNPGGAVTQSINPVPPLGTTAYSVTLGYGNVGCSNSANTNVTVNQTPDVNAVANQFFCAGSTTTTISLTGSLPGTTYNWTNSNTAIGLAASGSGDIAPFVATNGTAAPISGTITVTPVNGGCTGAPITFTITVAVLPQITSVTNDAICGPGVANLGAAGNGTINWYDASVAGNLVHTGTTYSPSVTNTTTYYVESTVTAPASQTVAMPAQSGTFPGNVRGYWFTAPVDFVMTSLFVPTTASSGDQQVAVVKFTGNVPPPVFSATTNAFTTLFLIRNFAGAGTIGVNIPIHAGEVIGILGNRADLNSYAPGDYLTSIFGQPVQFERLGMQFPLSSNNPHDIWREFGPATSISRIEFSYASIACTSAPRVPVTATVKPIPDAVATPASQTTCSGQTITTIVLSGAVPATTFNWTRDNTGTVTGIAASGSGNISGALTNTTASPITVTFTIIPVANGCTGTPVTATVLVNPTPDAIATPSSQTACSGPITPIILTGSVSGTVFNWIRNNTVSVTGIAASGSGDISGSLTNTTTAPVTVTFTITPTANGCTPGAPITATVLVNPVATVNAVANQSICHNTSTAAITFSSPTTGGTIVYNWTNNNTTIGLGASGTGNIPSFVGTNPGTAPVTATITVTPTYTNGVSCVGTPRTFTITVNPIPNAVATPSSQTICSAASITPIVLTGAVTGTTFTWIRNNTVNVTGIAASGSGTPISGTLTNITNVPQTVTFTITPSANGCTGPTTTATVIVNPTPTVTPPGQMQVIITGNGFFADEITWTLTNSLGTVVLSGGPYGLNPPPTASALVPSTNGPFTFFIEAQGTFNDNSCLWQVNCGGNVVASGCIRGTASFAVCANVGTLTVPNILGCGSNISPQTICSGTAIAPITLVGPVAGTVFNWTRDNNVNVTGIPASGSGNISGTLTNITNTPQTVNFTITPTANGCNGPAVIVSILVNPTPNAVATPSSQTICSGTAITPIVLTGAVAGTTYAWTRNNTANITGIPASGSGTPISGTLTNTTVTLQTTTFAIIPTANGCVGPVTNATVSVQAPLTIVCPANITVNAAPGTCAANVSFAATVTGTPAPTVTYTPASGSSFPIGTTTVNVTATNICGTVTCSFTVTVLDVQIPNITTQPVNKTVCVGSSATFTVVSTFATSYQWQTWNGTAWVNIAGANASSYTVSNVTHAMNANSYRVQITGPCGTVTTSVHAVLYVNPLPTISISSNIQPQLLPGQLITLTANGSPAGGTFVWFKNNVIIPGATGITLGPLTVDDAGIYKVVYTDPNGCVNTSVNFTISALITGNLYIYPNPNSGVFHVRFYNAANVDATITVYNYLGAIVYQKKFTTGPLAYSVIDVDMGQRLAIGTYAVDVRDADGNRIGAKLISVGRQ